MFKEKYNEGKILREITPRSSHAKLHLPLKRTPVERMISQSNEGRLPELVPIRHFRMGKSPFTFYRGTASLMANDLSCSPSTGVNIQACGDSHLMNFGGFATPERTLIVDMNDFDETNPGPWEWDLKRLAASFLLACREKGYSASDGHDVTMQLMQTYQQKIYEYSTMNFLDLWYSKLTLEEIAQNAKTKEGKALITKAVKKANEQTHDTVFYKITANTLGKIEITDHAPLIYHPIDVEEQMAAILSFMDDYKSTLQNDRRQLLDQYKVVDVALKVVGVGSVGTRCMVVLLMNDNKEPLFLQVKEAGQSVLEPFTGKSKFQHSGERVVQGQRLIQSASDVFLGWAKDHTGRCFYLRQLRDKKMSPSIEEFNKTMLGGYATICGNILARAHCKTGQGALICGYIGKGEVFANAICKFSALYADQTEKDYADFMKAIKDGVLTSRDDAPKDL
ncbi:DUF2252 domain-containing protein [Mucilaginibacter sp. X4EP1]|uniref:DUF2252 domain-containing protein n=1 Tax=Mucilaginibacter sp. X4EP1 TaxID=2723092 RepID=UPI0021689FEB|nr:DUF2252 domain-containing protein [Mucilaginibacter sp. X4EP1]MCS3813321.1 uncharacterized protein (DUF2252 family) [Mucilaginibacter sp. X4EP1]